jgi:hypothetical protein
MISRALTCLVVLEGSDLDRTDVIIGLGFVAVGTGAGGVLHPVTASPTVASAPEKRVRRATAPPSRSISISPELKRPLCA